MEAIPGGTICLPAEVGLLGIRGRDAIVAWNEQEQGEDDRRSPKDGSGKQQVEGGLVSAIEPEFSEDGKEPEAVPERHGAAKGDRDGSGGHEMGVRRKAAKCRVDEDGDGNLIAEE